MDHEVAFFVGRFVQILFWVDLEDVIAHLEPYWLDFGGNIFAWFLNMAEGLVRFAVKFWKSCGPFHSDFLEDIWWN